jgi:hypothetical protein
MLPSVSYSTIVFLLFLNFLSPRIFLILLSVIVTFCTVLEHFVKLHLPPAPEYLRLRFGIWCFSSSIVSIAVYICLCFINLIHNWISRIIQLSLNRLHFPQLVCILVISFLFLKGPRLWATVSTWLFQNNLIMKNEQSSTTAKIEPYHGY